MIHDAAKQKTKSDNKEIIEKELQKMASYKKELEEFNRVRELLDFTEAALRGMEEYQRFVYLVNESVQFLLMLLCSKTQQDTIQTIILFMELNTYGI